MSTEAPTRLDAESAAIMAERARATADLNRGTDAQVPNGSEATPLRRPDSIEAIKAMYARARDQRRAEQAAHEAAGSPNALQPDVGTEPAHGMPRREAPAPTPEPASAAQPAAQPLPEAPQYVSVVFQGRPISVPARDIERAGGQEAYLRARQMDEDEIRLAQERQRLESAQAEVNARVEEMRRLQAELQQSQTAGQGSPATGPGVAAGQASPATGMPGNQAAELSAEAERLSSMLYSGDPEDARQAVAAILAEARAARQTVSAEQVARQAVALLQATVPQGAGAVQPNPAPVAAPPVHPLIARIDAMAVREFPGVVNDPVQRAAAWAMVQQRCALPENQERSAVDIAREVCEEVEMTYANPRRGVIEVKRGLPPVPQASATAPAPAESRPLSPSEWVAHVAKARQFR